MQLFYFKIKSSDCSLFIQLTWQRTLKLWVSAQELFLKNTSVHLLPWLLSPLPSPLGYFVFGFFSASQFYIERLQCCYNPAFSIDVIKMYVRPCSADLTLFCPDHLLQPECLPSNSAESIPPQRLHGSRAVQPLFVWFSRPLPAQNSRQRRLLASEPRDPQYPQRGWQAKGHR